MPSAPPDRSGRPAQSLAVCGRSIGVRSVAGAPSAPPGTDPEAQATSDDIVGDDSDQAVGGEGTGAQPEQRVADGDTELDGVHAGGLVDDGAGGHRGQLVAHPGHPRCRPAANGPVERFGLMERSGLISSPVSTTARDPGDRAPGGREVNIVSEASIVYASGWARPRPRSFVAVVEPSGLVRLRGELDVVTAPTFRRALAAAARRGGLITVDLHHLDVLGAAGIEVIVSAAKALVGHGRIVLSSPRAAVARTLRISRVDAWLRRIDEQ